MAKTKILLIAGSKELGDTLKHQLTRLGYEVTDFSEDDFLLLGTIHEFKPDVVLLDVFLKNNKNSMQLAEMIKTAYALPVIYLCSQLNRKLIHKIKNFDSYGYLFYPYRTNELVAAIEMGLDRYRREQWLNSTLACLTEGVLATDKEGRIKYCNNLAKLFLGLNPQEDFLNHHLKDVLPPAQKEFLEYYKSLIKSRDADCREESREFPIYTSGEFILSLKAFVLRNLKENGWLLLFRDVSEQKTAENKLEQVINKLRRTLGGVIEAINLTVEFRDPYTAGHQRKVSYLARIIGQELGLSNERIECLRIAGIIHDLGKLYIPVEILAKPSKLTLIEFELIKQHPQTGYDILKNIEFPWPIAEVVLQHHERMNGGGYPLGLIGNQIMEEARILAVADVIEAMTSNRPYRPALGWHRAVKEVVQNKGTLYDPAVVDAYLNLISAGEFF